MNLVAGPGANLINALSQKLCCCVVKSYVSRVYAKTKAVGCLTSIVLWAVNPHEIPRKARINQIIIN